MVMGLLDEDCPKLCVNLAFSAAVNETSGWSLLYHCLLDNAITESHTERSNFSILTSTLLAVNLLIIYAKDNEQDDQDHQTIKP